MNKEEQLLKLPEEIKNVEENIWKLTIDLEKLKEQIELDIAKMEMDINEEKDVITGKALFSNDSMRKNELKLRLAKDEGLQKKFDEIKTDKNLIRLDEIERDYKVRLFSTLKRLVERKEDYTTFSKP